MATTALARADTPTKPLHCRPSTRIVPGATNTPSRSACARIAWSSSPPTFRHASRCAFAERSSSRLDAKAPSRYSSAVFAQSVRGRLHAFGETPAQRLD